MAVMKLKVKSHYIDFTTFFFFFFFFSSHNGSLGYDKGTDD